MGEAQDAFIIFDEAYEGNDVDAFYLGKFHSSIVLLLYLYNYFVSYFSSSL